MQLAHALYSAADDYWPLDEISYSRVYNWRNWNWKARVKGTIIIGAWRPLGKYPRAHLRNWYIFCYRQKEFVVS